MQEMIDIDSSVCRKCKYYWGEFWGNTPPKDPSTPIGAMCGYYIDTGKHRVDSFNANDNTGIEKYINKCNKFEYREDGYKREVKLPPVSPIIR